jgi:CheY-like chemotaxis protein
VDNYPKSKPIEILLVEDNPADVRLTQEVFKDCRILNNLHIAKDGIEAMDFLTRKGDFKDKPMPDLVLLDLNLPKKDGREVLADMKNDPELKKIPVIVLTTSEAEQDIVRSYNLGANCYITKPVDLNQFIRVVHGIEDFWLTIVKLPTRIRM